MSSLDPSQLTQTSGIPKKIPVSPATSIRQIHFLKLVDNWGSVSKIWGVSIREKLFSFSTKRAQNEMKTRWKSNSWKNVDLLPSWGGARWGGESGQGRVLINHFDSTHTYTYIYTHTHTYIYIHTTHTYIHTTHTPSYIHKYTHSCHHPKSHTTWSNEHLIPLYTHRDKSTKFLLFFGPSSLPPTLPFYTTYKQIA